MASLRPLGIAHFYPKPFDVDHFLETVRQLTSR
jgi:hypothetical protein